MSYALIESALGEGRYRVKLDYGEAQRQALIAANEQALAQITYKMEVAREAVLVAEINEAAAREAIRQLIEQIVIVGTGDPALTKQLQTILDAAKQRYGKLVSSNSPVRRQFETLKSAHAEGVRRRIRWNALQTIEYRDAWCADYTLEASGYAATLDIPGDTSLVLLAPGCRAWRAGDGTITTARKSGNIAILQGQLTPLTDERGNIRDTLIPKAETDERALVVQRNLALEAVQLAPTQANRETLEQASQRLDAQRAELRRLRDREAVLSKQIDAIDFQIAQWNNRPASDSPEFGDGRYLIRDLCSPEQTFFNAAIFPGWQKFKPTYRTGRITYINYDANIASVTLDSATSTASGERLDTNQTPQLNGIPVVYMSCAARAFDVGDDVVVRFASQRWEEPTVIGFADTPKQCPPIFVGGQIFRSQAIQLQIGIPMVHQEGWAIIDGEYDFSVGETAIENCWIGGKKPYSYVFIDGDEPGEAPPGISIDQDTGEIVGTPTGPFETRTLKVRCYDDLHVEGDRRYSDSTPIEFSYGRIVPHGGSYNNAYIVWWAEGSLTASSKDSFSDETVLAERGQWFDYGESPWAETNLAGILTLGTPRFTYWVRCATALDANGYCDYLASGEFNEFMIWDVFPGGPADEDDLFNNRVFSLQSSFGYPQETGTTSAVVQIGYRTGEDDYTVVCDNTYSLGFFW